MKVAVLKPEIVDDNLVFKIEEKVKNKSFEELNENNKLTEDLKKLNLQRFIIRKGKEIDKASLSKEFRK